MVEPVCDQPFPNYAHVYGAAGPGPRSHVVPPACPAYCENRYYCTVLAQPDGRLWVAGGGAGPAGMAAVAPGCEEIPPGSCATAWEPFPDSWILFNPANPSSPWERFTKPAFPPGGPTQPTANPAPVRTFYWYPLAFLLSAP
jgi:hypothetical protein